jgi:hypothetical protein
MEPYDGWQRLPPFERIGFAYQRTDDARNVMKVVIPYTSAQDADAAAAELERRLQTYVRILDTRRLCANVDVSTRSETDTFVVIASCEVERPGDWQGVLFQDTLFLVEELPRD